MTTTAFENKIAQTIQKLSDPASYQIVCHQHKMGEPLPSIVKLGKIINLVREILFPGYFGNTSLRTNTTQHYMGVYVDELYELLSEEILAGMCFECKDESVNKVEKHQGKS
ncbi:MAG: serine acetyltransferase, partial [Bacteroidales bacterium]|nr:serine acetyltransferase [Bacteroidales bacterium]